MRAAEQYSRRLRFSSPRVRHLSQWPAWDDRLIDRNGNNGCLFRLEAGPLGTPTRLDDGFPRGIWPTPIDAGPFRLSCRPADLESTWTPAHHRRGCRQEAHSISPGLMRVHSELPAVPGRELTFGHTLSQHRRENSRTMVPHGPAAILLFLVSLILSCGHLVESFDAVVFIGVLYQLFWLNCVFFTRGNLVEESSVRSSAFLPRWLRLRKIKHNSLRWKLKMPQKPLSAGLFPWNKGPGAVRSQQPAAPQANDFDHLLASISLASQQKVAAAASAKDSYVLQGRDKLSAFSELATAQLVRVLEECEVDTNDIPLLLGMVAALQQRPEIVSKISGQIAGMGQPQTVEILNVRADHTTQEILESIQKLDPDILSVAALHRGAMKDSAITNANGQGLSAYTTVQIIDLPVSDKMLSTLSRGGLAGMEEWSIRPHQPRAVRSDLPGLAIKTTDGSRKMLALLRAAGMRKVEIEQLLRSTLNKKLEGTVAAGTVTEVFLHDTKDLVFVDEKKQVRNSRGAADFTEVGRGLVTLTESTHESFVVQHLGSQLDFTLGDALDVPALTRFSLGDSAGGT
jgi:hypothetical protein